MKIAMKLVLATAVVVAVAATGCGGGNGTTTTSGGTATISSVAAPCAPRQLRIRIGHGGAAAGHGLVPFILRNASGPGCSLRHFPHVVLLDRSGSPMPGDVKASATDFFGHLPVSVITVHKGDVASFHLTTIAATSGGNCPTAHALRVTWSGSDDELDYRLGRLSACPDGVTVSPFTAGRPSQLRTQIQPAG